MNPLFAIPESSEQLYKLRIEDLQKQLDTKNSKIDNFQKELKFRSDELAQQVNKHRMVCEARDEYKFKVVQLESSIKVLRVENENLKSQLKTQQEVKDSLALETLVASYADQIKKYEEKVKACEFKITQLEAEKYVTTSPSEKYCDQKYVAISNEGSSSITQLKSDITILRQKIENLNSQLVKEKEIKNTTVQKLEAHVEKYADQLKKCEETLKTYETRIAELQNEKKEIACSSKKYTNELKDLQTQLANHRNSVLKHEEELQAEKNKNILLRDELEILKSLCKKKSSSENLQPETSGTNKIVREMEMETKGTILELQECENILKNFVEQQRNLQMKFELEMEGKLLHTQKLLVKTEKVSDSPKDSPVGPQDKKLQEAAEVQESVIKVEENTDLLVEPSPLRPQNKRHQKTAKTEKLGAQRPTKSKIANITPHKKTIRKNKKMQDENMYSPLGEKNPASLNDMLAKQNLHSVQGQGGRQLRSRRKVV